MKLGFIAVRIESDKNTRTEINIEILCNYALEMEAFESNQAIDAISLVLT